MKLLLRIVPILLISIILSFFLKVSLLVISGLLFSYLIYIFEKKNPEGSSWPDNKKLFFLSVLFTLGSKILFFLKDIYLNHSTYTEAFDKLVAIYKICYLSASYQYFGFIKRGLIPTIVNLISPDYLVQIYTVQLLGLGTFIVGLLLLNKRKEFSLVNRRIFTAVLLLSPIGLYSFFNFNLGFYDMILVGLLFISMSFSFRPASVFADIIGLLVHEAYIFIRLPFLLLNLFSVIRSKKPVAPVLTSMFINLSVLLLIILMHRPGLEQLKANYFLHYPELKSRTVRDDYGAFDPLCREGTLAFSLNLIKRYIASAKAASYMIPFLVSLVCISLLGFITNTMTGKYRLLDVLASLFVFIFPFFLGVVGGDYGRWFAFAYVNWAIYYILFRPNIFPEAQLSYRYIYILLLVTLIISPFGVNYNYLFYKIMGY